MLRKTLTILSLLGLVLSVGLWAASYFLYAVRLTSNSNIYWLQHGSIGSYGDLGFRASRMSSSITPVGGLIITASDAAVQITANDWLDLPAGDFVLTTNFDGTYEPFTHWGYAGFNSLTSWWTPSLRFKPFGFILPLWMVTGSFAAMAWYLYFLPIHRRRKRKKLGLCLKCGYDLRGSKERCPECGELK